MERSKMIETLVRAFNRTQSAKFKWTSEKTTRFVNAALDVGGEGAYDELLGYFTSSDFDTIKKACAAYIEYKKANPSEKPACKFKVGDKVIGNSNEYSVTCKGWIGKVVEVCSGDTIKVSSAGGFRYTVQAEHFDLYEEPSAPAVYEAEVEDPAPAEDPAKRTVTETFGILEKALAEVIVANQGANIASQIVANMSEQVDAYIRENYGTVKRKIEVTVDEKPVVFEERLHSKFETVLKFVKMNEPVFLTGAAGCGKNVICKQVAKALGLPFYFSNAVTQEYKITGFTDANGTFHETQFYKAFKNGGVFMLDEIDASIPEVLVILNAAIANRYFDFPAPIGYVEAHPDFRVIAAGNTFGLGADYEYVGRNQLDMASLDRFALVPIDYDRAIELQLAENDSELVDFAEDFREAAKKCGIHCIVSYRAIQRIAKMSKLMEIEEVLASCLLKNLQKDDINMIVGELKCGGKYLKAVKEIAGR